VRARVPDLAGTIVRDGVPIAYEVHGDRTPTLLLVPPAPITHSRIFKAQVHHLARRHRVVTMDGRGNGRSGRPRHVEAHTRRANVQDILAVLDETGTERAVLVAHCHACWWLLDVASEHPERVRGLVLISPGIPYIGPVHPHWVETARTWDVVPDDPTGWQLNNRHVYLTQHRRWVEFFFGAQLVEPHSTKQHEDAVSWALESTGEILVAGEEAQALDPPPREAVEAACRDLSMPVLVIHGDRDVCQHVDRGRAVADLVGGDLVVVEGAGHLVPAREPVTVNRAISGFVDRLEGAAMHQRVWTRAMDRTPRVLYLSSPIGLGHARRDLAIAHELRSLRPQVQIDWLAQDPVSRVLEAQGEAVHPASRWLASESAHFAAESAGHDLHCFQALRRMDEIMVANFMVFQEVVEEGHYDLVVSDEAWDVDHFWHENPELKRGAHAWLTDFVGFLPMPDGGAAEAALTADYNAEMIEHVERFPRIRDRAIFVGNPDDVVPGTFGPDLPGIRDWTEAHFDFSGYITGFTPPTPDEAAAWREELAYGAGEPVCVVAVGGSGVGRDLLDRAVAAHPLARRAVPDLRTIVVTGPRIDPRGFPDLPGLDVRGYVPDLHRHLAACDLAIVQGGLTTAMELTAAKRPFLYFPLGHHFEQHFHVRHRLDRYRAGRCMDFRTTDPDALAAAIAAELGRPVDYVDVETHGAATAARQIAQLV
jgi:pimeloyl-ACP methyl ester carboxylesterase/predicted glycosyltransferase